jgi:hypothetical protein
LQIVATASSEVAPDLRSDPSSSPQAIDLSLPASGATAAAATAPGAEPAPVSALAEPRRRGKGASKKSWSDASTDVIQSGVLKKRLESMRALDEGEPSRLGARGHVFPHEAWQRFWRDLVAYLRSAPLQARLLAGAIVVVPLALIVELMVAWLGSGRHVAFVSDAQALLSGPLAGEAYPQLAPVERGGRVEVVERVGEYSLVKDSVGRVGYLRSHTLRRDPPPAVPSQAFADCSHAPVDHSLERCQGRAQEQFEACRSFCNTDAEDPSCLEHCQKRFADCLGTCEQADGAVAPAAADKSMRAADTPAAATRENASEPNKKRPKRPAARKKKGR